MAAPRQPAPRAADARARLLGAAVDAFAARGFHGTTTRDIAAAAGMSPAALYVHHRSKEELLYEISLAGHRRTLEVVEQALAGGGDARERLGAGHRGLRAPPRARTHHGADPQLRAAAPWPPSTGPRSTACATPSATAWSG